MGLLSLVRQDARRVQIDPAVSEIFALQVEIMTAPDGSQQFEHALARRDRLLAALAPAQRSHMSVIASAVGRLAARG